MKMIDDTTLIVNPEDKLQSSTLYLFLSRGEASIREWTMKTFRPFEQVVINVDEEEHVYSANTLIRLLKYFESTNKDQCELTVDQVKDAVLENFEEMHEINYDVWELSKFDWQAIVDNLNAALKINKVIDQVKLKY